MKNKFKMTIGFFLVLLLLSSCVQSSQNVGLMGRNIQITNDYDGIWQLKMYVGYEYFHSRISVVNGQFYEKYPNGNIIKGYISGDGRFSMYYTFNHGGWNFGAFSFTLDRERTTTTRIVGKWSGLDSAYLKGQDGQQYGGGRWEAIISQQQSKPTSLDYWKMDLGKTLSSNWVQNPKYKELDPCLKSRIYLKVLKNGHIEFIELESSSGNDLLDEAAINAVKQAAPFKELPEGKETHSLVVIFTPKGLK